jgi:hypothetical protein
MLTISRGFFILLAVALCAPLAVQAQELTREEKKEYKQIARNYRKDLYALKTLLEEHQYYQEQANQAQTQISDLNAQLVMKDRQVNDLQQQNADLNQQIIALQQAPPPPPQNQPGEVMTDQPVLQGVVYRVQIGAFGQNQVENDLATSPNLSLEASGDLQKVVVGQFTNYANAKRLRDRMRQMGVTDAFIVAYNDGMRIDIREAMRLTGEG